MAGNYGKFIDRAPIICAAGKSAGDPNDTVASIFKQYRLVDEIDALKHDAKIWKEKEFIPPRPLPPIQNSNFLGTNTEISEILRPPVLTRYQQLIGDLKDTPYCSYWNAEIGKARDPVPGLPRGLNPVETTFGEPPKKDISVKELVNPSKSHYQVLRESQLGHEMYKTTHNDFNPSEKIHRNYKNFNPKKCFGEKTTYDPRGMGAYCACDWYKKEPLTHAYKLQADFFKRTRHQIGQVLSPNNNIELVPKGHVFGKPSKQEFYGMEDLLKDPNVKPCLFKRDLYQWLASLNKVRVLLKGLNLEDIYKRALNLDKDKSGLLDLEEFYKLCHKCHHIIFPKDLENLCDFLKYIQNGQVNYRKFIDLIDINKDPSDIKPIKNIPEENLYYTSTSQAASCDYLFINNNNLPPAGTPSVRHDLSRPVAPQGGCRADIEHLGDETSAKAVVNPSIYTHFGLTYRDFFKPRSPKQIKELFEKLGYNFKGDNFENLWQKGLKEDQTDGEICVDTFKRLLKTDCPSLKLRVDEKQIECEKYIS